MADLTWGDHYIRQYSVSRGNDSSCNRSLKMPGSARNIDSQVVGDDNVGIGREVLINADGILLHVNHRLRFEQNYPIRADCAFLAESTTDKGERNGKPCAGTESVHNGKYWPNRGVESDEAVFEPFERGAG